MPYSAGTSGFRFRGRYVSVIGGMVALILMVFMPRVGNGAEPKAANLAQLSAIAGGYLAPGIRVAIEPGPDDAEFGTAPLYIAVRNIVDRELARRGFRVGGASNLTLKIRIDITGFKGRRRRTSDVFPGLPPTSAQDDGRSSVIHQFVIPLDERYDRSPSKTSIVLVLFKPGEPPLWSATVTANARGGSAETLVSSLTNAAMASFGVSAKRSFVLH